MANLLEPGKMNPVRTTFSKVVRTTKNQEAEKGKVDGRKNNRGSDHRKRYTNEYKAKVLDEWFNEKSANPNLSQDAFAALYGITQGDLNRWISNKDKIFQEGAVEATRRLMSSGGKNISKARIKFPEMEAELHLKFKTRRGEGRRCSASWIKKTAKKIQKEKDPDSDFTASRGWFYLFLKRFNLTSRKRSNSKQGSVFDRIPFIREFHRKFRLFLSLGDVLDRKWGRFLPNARFNADQVPLPFVCEQDQTYEEKGARRVWIRQMEEGMTKRFCTLHLCFRPEGPQMKPTIIFRGQGIRLTRLEREAWDNRVIVMFQAKAWADRKFITDWCTQHFIPFVTSQLPLHSEKVFFCDNLDAQVQPVFLAILRSINCFRWLLPVKSTSETQPVDAGLGRLLKYLISVEFEEWLEIDENLDLWETGKLTASEKRILVTRFVGSAWEKLFSNPNYTPRAYFEKTGCLLCLDGSEDSKVKIEGMSEYRPPVAPNIDEDEIVVAEQKQNDPSLSEIENQENSDVEPEVLSDVTDEGGINVEEF